jgi:hypothetical protein
MLLVNGEQDQKRTTQTTTSIEQATSTAQHPQHQSATPDVSSTTELTCPAFTFETLKRVVTSDLLRADTLGRRTRLNSDEAKRLATSILDRLNVPNITSDSPSGDVARITAASWLGVGDHYNVPLGPAAGHGKRINVTRFRVGNDGYEEIVSSEESSEGVREVFDMYWQVSLGGCMGSFEMKGLCLSSPQTAGLLLPMETTHDLVLRKGLEAMYSKNKEGWVEESMSEIARSVVRTSGANATTADDGVDWKVRCKQLEFAAHIAKGEVERLKKRNFERVMAAVLEQDS